MYNTQTVTTTYTVIDIRKAFEGFDADLRMISKRTGKWTTEYVEKILHDIIRLAEDKYINYIDITLLDLNDKPIRATRYKVNEDGKAVSTDRPGGNDWTDIPETKLTVIVSYSAKWHSLTAEVREQFQKDNNFKIGWTASNIDNSYSHLQSENSQLYARKGYEVQKSNFK
jgi:hypothetical protein